MRNWFYAELGIPTELRILLVNNDDLGMSWGANQAFVDLSAGGTLMSGSVMVPCPWFPHLAEIANKHPELSIGVHLTLTSEWTRYRWRPLSTHSKNSGLIDQDGYFWRTRNLLRDHVVREAAEIELKMQIETALSAGIDVTHLDCHMGIGFIPELFDIYVNLGVAYKIPVLLFREINDILDFYKINLCESSRSVYNIIDKFTCDAYPRFDEFKITPCFASSTAQTDYEHLILGLPEESVSFLSLHPNRPGDIEQIDPILNHVRIDEYEVFNKCCDLQWAKMNRIQMINFRQIRDALRDKGFFNGIKNV